MKTIEIFTIEGSLFLLWIAALMRWIAEMTLWIATLMRWVAFLMTRTPQLANTPPGHGWNGVGTDEQVPSQWGLPAERRPSRPRKAPVLPRRRDLWSKAEVAARWQIPQR